MEKGNDSGYEHYMRNLSDVEMTDFMRRFCKNKIEAWREVMMSVDGDEAVQAQNKKVDRAIGRAEKAMDAEGLAFQDRSSKEEAMLDRYPYVGKAIDKATAELVFHYTEAEDWDSFEKTVLSNSGAIQMVFECMFGIVPDERKYNLTLEAYKWGGAKSRDVQRALMALPEYGKPDLPDDFGDEVVVYRGCVGDAKKAADSFSWTINIEVAKYFRRAQETFFGEPAHIYRGKIRKEDIAAYIIDVGQAEVINLGGVHDVEDITEQVHDERHEQSKNQA